MPNKWKEHNLLWSWTTVGKTIALSAWLCYMIIFRFVLLIIQPYIVFPQLLGSETRVIGCIQYIWFVANELKHAETDPSRVMISVLQYPHLDMLNITSEWAFYVTWMKLIQTQGERPSVHYMQMDIYLGSNPFSLLVVINAQHNELHWGLLRMLNVFKIY